MTQLGLGPRPGRSSSSTSSGPGSTSTTSSSLCSCSSPGWPSPSRSWPRPETAADKRPIYLKLVKRALLLVLLGFVYNHLTDLQFATQRYASVLGQIGLAYLFAALIMLNVRSLKGRLAALAGILAGYAAVQLLVPVPGIGAGVLTPEGTINGWVDRLLLPGRLYDKIFDPEGILCVLSATSVTLMGGLAGLVLCSERLAAYRKTLVLASSGVGLTIAGYVLGGFYPIIKKAWTATFDIYAAGLSFILLALFYLVIDVWGLRRWSFFFRVIGLNSITIYLGTRMIDFDHTSQFLFGGLARLSGTAGVLVLEAGADRRRVAGPLFPLQKEGLPARLIRSPAPASV